MDTTTYVEEEPKKLKKPRLKGTSNQRLCEAGGDGSPYNLLRLLKVCTKAKDIHKGSKVYEYVRKQNYYEKSNYFGGTLISMYAKCGALAKAHQVLKELPLVDVVSWTALIAGYAQHGQAEEALKCFDDMLHEGHSPNAVTFTCVLKACGGIREAAKGEEIHGKIASLGIVEKNVVLGTTLVDMYAKCNALAKAHRVLKELPMRNVVSWSALIAGYAQHGQGEEALKCFDDMICDGHSPNAVTFICVLKACGRIGAAAKGEEIHDKIVCLGMLENDVVLGTALMNMYAKCGELAKAHQVLKEFPMRNVVSWNALIAGYVQHGQGEEALTCFDDMLWDGHSPDAVTFICVLKACESTGATPKGKEIHDKIVSLGMLEKDVVVGNALVYMYAKFGELARAQQVLKELPIRNVLSWSALIAGYAQHKQGEEGLKCFNDMLHDGHYPDAVTFACVLRACGSIAAIAKGEEIHVKVVSLGMLEKDVVLGTTLVDMYVKCGALAKAQQVLQQLHVHDGVCWNALVAGYAQHGQGEKALKCFDDMLCDSQTPNAVTFICVLKACGNIRAAAKGEEIHNKIVGLGMLEKDVVLGNALVDMYAKCGALAMAHGVLKELPMRNVVSWSSLIAGYTRHRQGEEALKCFDDMLRGGHSPDAVTFICVLKACGSIRAAAKGAEIHDKILCLGMLEKDVLLGTALVNMYANCGAIAKAHQVLKELPMHDVVSWNGLIAGYAQHGQGEEALKCFDGMLCDGCFPNAMTFVCVLKACGSIGATAKGQEIHGKLVSLGMLEKDIVLGNTLVDMYIKNGELAKAHQVLEELPIRNIVSWNALIAEYAHHRQGEEALKFFYYMLCDGSSPNAITFICILKACGSIGAVAKGEEIYDKIVSLGMLEKGVVLGTTLMDMYAKCGELAKAHQVFKELPMRNVVSWNVLIAGYSQHGHVEEALKCFDHMLYDGHSPDAVTFICVLKACGNIRAMAKGEEFHNKIVSLGMLETEIVVGNTMVDMYAKCGELAKAHRVLNELPMRNVVSWSSLIAGYAQHGQGEEALICFNDMLHDGHSPDAIIFTCVLKACGSIGAIAKGEEIHDEIVTLGMVVKDVVLGTALLDMYVKCGALSKALQVLKELPIHDVVCWNVLIAGYAQHQQGEEALKCFDDMLLDGHSPDAITFICVLKACGNIGAAAKGEEFHKRIISLRMLEKDVVLGNTLVDMYAKCGALVKAYKVLRELPMRNVVSWSALIAGYAYYGHGEEALKCFDDMLRDGDCPDAVTFLCALKACGSIGAAVKGEEIHYKIVSLGILEKDVVLGTALLDMYAKCGELAKAHQVLKELPMCDVVSWNALITGYTQQGEGEEALKCFNDMLCYGQSPDAITFICVLKACGSIRATVKGKEIHDKIVSLGMLDKDVVLGNTLVNMYGKCNELAKAYRVLKALPMHDVVSWNVLIAGYAQHGQGEEALKCFDDMLCDGHSPDAITFTCVLKACGSIGAAAKGEQIHHNIVGLGMLQKNVVIGNILLDMYVKCGALDKVQEVLKELPIHDAVCWNTQIAGYSQQGQSVEAVNCFEQMQSYGVKPDLISLTSVLSACSHAGLLDQSEIYFSGMKDMYGICPSLKHYGCMIDTFGRAGNFRKALSVVEGMPIDKCLSSWVALLGACRKWAEEGIGTLAFEHALNLDKCNAAAYVLLSDIYIAAGMQQDALN